MALLKPQFLRAHPVQSGLLWAALFAGVFLLLGWTTGIIPVNLPFVALLIVCSVMGGLAWGYAMKAFHDRMAGKL